MFLDKEIFHETKDTPFKWSDIKHIQFEDDDLLKIEFVEAHYSDNNSWDHHYSCTVIRKVLETDEQFQERVRRNELLKKELKERRYETYLKLKQEFETPTLTRHD